MDREEMDKYIILFHRSELLKSISSHEDIKKKKLDELKDFNERWRERRQHEGYDEYVHEAYMKENDKMLNIINIYSNIIADILKFEKEKK